MRIRYICLLLLSFATLAWGMSSPAQAATDIQQSQYEVRLTPPNQLLTGSDGAVIDGSEGDAGQPSTGNTTSQGTNAATGNQAPVTATQYADASKTPLSGRLPQLSEQQWTGFKLIGVIIMALLLGIWKLSRKTRRS